MTVPSKAVRVQTTYLETLRKRYGEHLSDGELVQMALAEVTSKPTAEPLEMTVVVEGGAEPLGGVEAGSVASGPAGVTSESLGKDEVKLKGYFDAHWKYPTSGALGAEHFTNWVAPPKPYGFSVWSSKLPSMRPWYFRPGLAEHFRAEAKEWAGFTLVFGATATEPARSAAARGVPYLPGDVEVYFVVSDLSKALKTLVERTDVPFPLKVDVWKYADDKDYATLVDTYAVRYAAYYWDGKPWGTAEEEP
jgi:hypothetical protein